MIQARYGWNDEAIKQLSVGRFTQIIDEILEQKKHEFRDRLVQGSWIGFQLGAGGDLSFTEYLDHWGLLKENRPEDSRQVEAITAKEAIRKAESILEMARNKNK